MTDYTTIIQETLSLGEAFPTSILFNIVDNLTFQEALLSIPEYKGKVTKLPIFRLYINEVEKGLKSFNISRDLEGHSEILITTYDDTILEEDILKPLSITMTNPIGGDTIILFEGVLTNIEDKDPDKQLKLKGRGLDYYLENDLFIQGSDAESITGVFEYNQIKASSIANSILEGTSFTLIECPEDKISLKFDYEKRLRALQLIAEILNKILWIDNDYGVHIGSNSGTFTLEYLLSKRLAKSGEETFNKIIVIGGNDGQGKVPIAIAEDPNLITSQGVKARKFIIPQIRDNETALLLAKSYLNVYKTINYNLSVKLPPKFRSYLINVGNIILVDNVNYLISSIELNNNEIILKASPIRSSITLANYLERQLNQIETASNSNTFYNETSTILTAYEILDLDTAYYGGETPKTIVANDENTYTILSIIHFFIPDNFTPKEGALKLRWFGNEAPVTFYVIVNGEVYTPTNEGTSTDGDTLYTVTIEVSSLQTGWNNIYFVQGES